MWIFIDAEFCPSRCIIFLRVLPISMNKQNQRNYASRWAKSKKLCIEMGNWHSSSENMNKKYHASGAVAMFKQKWGEHVLNIKNYLGSKLNFVFSTCPPHFCCMFTILADVRKNRLLYVGKCWKFCKNPPYFPTYILWIKIFLTMDFDFLRYRGLQGTHIDAWKPSGIFWTKFVNLEQGAPWWGQEGYCNCMSRYHVLSRLLFFNESTGRDHEIVAFTSNVVKAIV